MTWPDRMGCGRARPATGAPAASRFDLLGGKPRPIARSRSSDLRDVIASVMRVFSAVDGGPATCRSSAAHGPSVFSRSEIEPLLAERGKPAPPRSRPSSPAALDSRPSAWPRVVFRSLICSVTCLVSFRRTRKNSAPGPLGPSPPPRVSQYQFSKAWEALVRALTAVSKSVRGGGPSGRRVPSLALPTSAANACGS